MYLEHDEVLVLNVRFHYHDLEPSKIEVINGFQVKSTEQTSFEKKQSLPRLSIASNQTNHSIKKKERLVFIYRLLFFARRK